MDPSHKPMTAHQLRDQLWNEIENLSDSRSIATSPDPSGNLRSRYTALCR